MAQQQLRLIYKLLNNILELRGGGEGDDDESRPQSIFEIIEEYDTRLKTFQEVLKPTGGDDSDFEDTPINKSREQACDEVEETFFKLLNKWKELMWMEMDRKINNGELKAAKLADFIFQYCEIRALELMIKKNALKNLYEFLDFFKNFEQAYNINPSCHKIWFTIMGAFGDTFAAEYENIMKEYGPDKESKAEYDLDDWNDWDSYEYLEGFERKKKRRRKDENLKGFVVSDDEDLDADEHRLKEDEEMNHDVKRGDAKAMRKKISIQEKDVVLDLINKFRATYGWNFFLKASLADIGRYVGDLLILISDDIVELEINAQDFVATFEKLSGYDIAEKDEGEIAIAGTFLQKVRALARRHKTKK